jgi:hypothetical protein
VHFGTVFEQLGYSMANLFYSRRTRMTKQSVESIRTTSLLLPQGQGCRYAFCMTTALMSPACSTVCSGSVSVLEGKVVTR